MKKTNEVSYKVLLRKVQQKEVIKKILAKINQGGLTYSPLTDKDYSGTENIAISPFPERSQIFTGEANEKIINDYCEDNNDLLLKNFSLGAWFDKVSQKTYLDISAPIPLVKQTEAIMLGKDANQIAGFNLSDFSEIPLGGNGRFNYSVTPFDERLEKALVLINNN